MSWATSLWAGVAVLGFAMVFSVPRSTLPGIVVLAVGAHLLRALFQDAGAALPLASFAAAAFVGLTAVLLAPRTGQATPIYAFAPVIPLVPGTYMFKALTAFMSLATAASPDAQSQIAANGITNATVATLTIIALAVGTIGPTLLLGSRTRR